MSPGLKRARAPYVIRNTLTGLLLGAFGAGVYTYSIQAVKQDVFEDEDVQAEPLSVAAASPVDIDDAAHTESAAKAPSPGRFSAEERGRTEILISDEGNMNMAAASKQSNWFVWGAPPVDNMGKMWEDLVDLSV